MTSLPYDPASDLKQALYATIFIGRLDSSIISPEKIFVNGILQEPGVHYSFSGGTSVSFETAPTVEDDVFIFFYRGTVGNDSILFDVNEIIKIGDDLIPLDSLKAWSIKEEGKLNKNNIIFQDKIYKKLSEELKKINDELIENRKSLKLEHEDISL